MKDRQWLESHLPHKGTMCLLDHVVSWTDDDIHCKAYSHKDPNNPLVTQGVLGSSAAIEYAAQAMAAHGCLLLKDDGIPRQGFIASVRNIIFKTKDLSCLSQEIDIKATRLMGDDDNVIYEFEVSDTGSPKVKGRATVVLDQTKAIKL
jgi:predicted hotdog family 3-hydroxylacyl-ACP dehydratase